MNPFGSGMPIDSMNQLLFRQENIDELENRIKYKKQTVILGVEGAGKSSLLQSFFCTDYRKDKAQNEGILISPVTEFPTDIDANECYEHFVKMVINAVKILGHCGKTDKMKKMLEELEGCKEDSSTAQGYFESVIHAIKNNGYRVVMLIDNFERFTLSKTITEEHHGILLKLLDHCQYIVATNYDLNNDSLPDNVSGSFFLMRFGGNDIRVGGWSESETKEFIQKQLQGNDIQFSEELIEAIYKVSGGIPTLLNSTAAFVYDSILKNNGKEDFDFEKTLYNSSFVQTLLSHWCKMVSSSQEEALYKLLKEERLNSGDEANLQALHSRGFLDYKMITDNYGRKRPDRTQYDFCCDFLRKFCEDKERIKDAMKKNPFFSCDEIEELKENILKKPFKPDEPYIFISYSHANQKDVFEDVCKLKTMCNCWIDFENLDGGRVDGEDDWTEKIKPVLDSEKCIGVISYFSPETITSNGTLYEAEWILKNGRQFYTFFLNFSENTNKEEIGKIIMEKSSNDFRRITAFGRISQADAKDATESIHQKRKNLSHLNESDFTNWIKRIFS